MNKAMTMLFIVIFILPFMVGFTAKSDSCETSDHGIYWMPFGEALKYARENDKIVFVYVHTDWCPNCKKMDDLTFSDATVQYYLREKFICTKINAESGVQHECNGQVYTEQQVAQMLGVDGYPTIIMLASSGGSLGSLSGYRDPVNLQQTLIYFGEGHYRKMPYNLWLKERQ